jgi:CheY-like chemotaxis protein
MPAVRILLADDNHDCIQSLARLLRLLGHEVLTAENGAEALASAESQRPDVMLLDIGMPGMSGYELAERLRENEQTRRAILLAISGHSSDECRQRAAAAGFDGYLVKPVSVQMLEQAIGRGRVANGSGAVSQRAGDFSLP